MKVFSRFVIALAMIACFSVGQVEAKVISSSSATTGGTTASGSLRNLMSGDASTTEPSAGAKILGAVSLMAYSPDFLGSPSVTVPNSVMTPGTTGSTTYTGTNARNIIMQDFYLYAQRESIKTGAQHFASSHIPSCVRAITTASPFAWKTNTPVFLPRYVCPDDAMSWERDGTGTTVAARSNWNGDPTTNQLNNLQQYMLIMSSGGTMAPGSKIVGNLNSVGSDGGSGFAYGRMYDVSTVTLQAVGSGGPVSGTSVCTVRNGDTISPSAGASFTVSTTAGGVASAITSPASGAYSRYGSGTGHYYLPPWAQRRQWTVANGWDGSDSRHPQVFADETSYYYNTSCTNGLTGVTVSLTWQPDWCLTGVTADVDSTSCTTRTDGPGGTNSYFGIFPGGSANTGFLDSIYMIQGRQNYSASYGYTNGVLISGYEVIVKYIQTQLSYYGLLIYGSDIVVDDFNDVTSAVQLKIRGGGGMHVLHARFDTPNDTLNSDGHAAEIDHCGNCSVKDWDYIATGSDSTHVAGAQFRLGSDTSVSGASSQNTNVYVGTGNISSDVTTGTNSLTAISCAYTNSSTIGAAVSNTGFANTAKTQQFTLHTAFGTNCENSNSILGSINNLSGSIFSGTVPSGGVRVWDDNAKGFAGPNGVYAIIGAGAPVDGTTADNKAATGSTYMNKTAGTLYTNTGTITDSIWTQVGSSTTTTPVALTDTSTVAWDWSTACYGKLSTTQSFTASNPTNMVAGQTCQLTISQDATGSRIVTWSANYVWPGGTKFVLSTGASKVDTITCYAFTTSNIQCVGQGDIR